MPCGVCHIKEKNANEEKDYLCGKCVCYLIGLDRQARRVFIDSLFLNGRDEEGEFLERFFSGLVAQKTETQTTKKLLLRKR